MSEPIEHGRFATEAVTAPTPAPSVPVRVEIDMLAIDDADAAAIGRRVLDMMGATWPTLRVVQAVRVVRR